MEENVLQKYRKSGSIAKEAREWSRGLIKEGAKLLDIATSIDKKIKELGGENAFPVNLSLNSIAAHYTPSSRDESVLKKGDLLKVDLGVHIEGFISDTAYTVEVGSSDNSRLIRASEKALDAAISIVKAGVMVSEIGAAIEKAIKEEGFLPIANLSGHEIDEYNLHAGLTIPNFDSGSTATLEEGMVIAIEPFATNGIGSVSETKESEIFSLINAKSVRLPVARKIMEYVGENLGFLPFSKRRIEKEIGSFGIETGIRELVMKGALHRYPILKEQGDGLVSQAEHTMIVTKDGAEVITK